MAYTDDWENLMNGVFGAGGRPRFGGTAQPESKTLKTLLLELLGFTFALPFGQRFSIPFGR